MFYFLINHSVDIYNQIRIKSFHNFLKCNFLFLPAGSERDMKREEQVDLNELVELNKNSNRSENHPEF